MIIFKKKQTAAEPARVAATPAIDLKEPAEETISTKSKKIGSKITPGRKRLKTDDERLL